MHASACRVLLPRLKDSTPCQENNHPTQPASSSIMTMMTRKRNHALNTVDLLFHRYSLGKSKGAGIRSDPWYPAGFSILF